MRSFLLLVCFCDLSCHLKAQITVTRNGETVLPNTTGINIKSNDLIQVTISGATMDTACFSNLQLAVSLIKEEKPAKAGKQQGSQSQNQQASARKKKSGTGTCASSEYKHLRFKSAGGGSWTCRFTAKDFWKKLQARGHIFLCTPEDCTSALTGLTQTVSNYSFYLMP